MENIESKKPNILLIVADQLRYDCIGYSRKYPVKTPNIDKLAAQGAWFENAYTPIPLCCPARQALLNGRRPEAFGAHWNYDITMKIPALNPSEYTWTKELKDFGYSMSYIGKWHVNPNHMPTDFGFDYYFGEKGYEVFHKENYPEVSYSNRWLGETDPIPLEESRTHYLANLAIKKIEEYEKNEKPWHIRLDFPEPHLPCRPAEPFAAMYSPQDIPQWEGFREKFEGKPYIQKQQLLTWDLENYTWEDWAPIVARYYGIISQMDDAIGRVLGKLDELSLSKNTIVIFTADHGDMCGSHGMLDKHYVMYEDIVKVPFIVRWPDKIPYGKVFKEYVSNCLDIAPTVLELLGLPIKDFFHGRSIVPLLKGEIVNDWRKEIVSTYNGQQFGLYNQRMILSGQWKYIWNPTDIDELYNLEEDPGELCNLIADESNLFIVAELRKRLYDVLLRDGDKLVMSPWMRNQLLNNKKL